MTEIADKNMNAMLDAQARVFKMASFLASSDIIPKHFQEKPANCFIALEMAKRLNIDFFELVNGLYVVSGRPGFTGAFVIGRINNSGLFKTLLQFTTAGKNEDMVVTAHAVTTKGTECSASASMHMAIAEGWSKNTKYRSMPEQMLSYRAATFFCRKFCPQILMGISAVEEIEDEIYSEVVKSPEIHKLVAKQEAVIEEENIKERLFTVARQAAECGVDRTKIQDIVETTNISSFKDISVSIEILETMMIEAVSKEGKDDKPNVNDLF